MIKAIKCQCGATVRFDMDKIQMFEYKDDIITNLIVCPICKQLIEVGSKPYPFNGGIDNVQLLNFDEYEVEDDSTDSPVA